jgi:hypothetical protein
MFVAACSAKVITCKFLVRRVKESQLGIATGMPTCRCLWKACLRRDTWQKCLEADTVDLTYQDTTTREPSKYGCAWVPSYIAYLHICDGTWTVGVKEPAAPHQCTWIPAYSMTRISTPNACTNAWITCYFLANNHIELMASSYDLTACTVCPFTNCVHRCSTRIHPLQELPLHTSSTRASSTYILYKSFLYIHPLHHALRAYILYTSILPWNMQITCLVEMLWAVTNVFDTQMYTWPWYKTQAGLKDVNLFIKQTTPMHMQQKWQDVTWRTP